jgi:4'-phosphopantetheinyl transferase
MVSASKNGSSGAPREWPLRLDAFNASISPGEICLWRASLDRIASRNPGGDRILAADEQARAARFVFERDRTRYAAGRAVLRIILGHYLERPPAGIAFRYEPNGKPALDGTDLSFNISHSDGEALFALTRGRRIGVDIERIRELAEMELLARRIFSPAERDLFGKRSADLRSETFFEGWTRKEALVKAVGAGLSMDLTGLEVLSDPDEPLRFLSLPEDPEPDHRWAIGGLKRDPGFAAAVAIEWPCLWPPRTFVFPGSEEGNGSD